MKNIFLAFLNKYKYHFLIWGIYIAYEVIMQHLTEDRLSSLKECIIAYSTGASIFYFHAHVLLKYTLNTKNRLLEYSLPLFIILELICYIVIRYLIEEYLYKYIGVEGFTIDPTFKIPQTIVDKYHEEPNITLERVNLTISKFDSNYELPTNS